MDVPGALPSPAELAAYGGPSKLLGPECRRVPSGAVEPLPPAAVVLRNLTINTCKPQEKERQQQ